MTSGTGSAMVSLASLLASMYATSQALDLGAKDI